jgi:hypothetical protein
MGREMASSVQHGVVLGEEVLHPGVVTRASIAGRATREAPVGVEPTIEDLQSSALPLGYGALIRIPPPEEE